jgi:hypothetical protein
MDAGQPQTDGGDQGFASMARKITSTRLTTCTLAKEGRAIRLGFLDGEGQPVAVEFSFEQAESIVMTLPQMLSKALQRRTQSPSSRYVFSLGRWLIESSDEQNLIVTLATGDGFQVSFSIPFDVCRTIGWSLGHESRTAAERDGEPIDDCRLLN